MSAIVRLGDKSSHGGTVFTATANFKGNGLVAAVDQDLHDCPLRGHGKTPITASAKFKSNGKLVVKVGDAAGCGATIIAGSSTISS